MKTRIDKLLYSMNEVVSIAQSELSGITALSRLALLGLESNNHHLLPCVQKVLHLIWEKAQCAEDGITTEIERAEREIE